MLWLTDQVAKKDNGKLALHPRLLHYNTQEYLIDIDEIDETVVKGDYLKYKNQNYLVTQTFDTSDSLCFSKYSHLPIPKGEYQTLLFQPFKDYSIQDDAVIVKGKELIYYKGYLYFEERIEPDYEQLGIDIIVKVTPKIIDSGFLKIIVSNYHYDGNNKKESATLILKK